MPTKVSLTFDISKVAAAFVEETQGGSAEGLSSTSRPLPGASSLVAGPFGQPISSVAGPSESAEHA